MFTLSNYKDVDDTVASIITEYYSLRDAGAYDEASALLEANKTTLKPYLITANAFNKIELGIYDLAKRHFYSQKIIISHTEPNAAENEMYENSEWLQEYV